MKLEVLDAKGKKVKEVELDQTIFGLQPNMALVHQVIKTELAGKRQGDASTKTRSKVRGGGAKPFRQKGTGRARAGSNRSPLWRGGGTVFGPQSKEYNARIPRKMRRLAVKSILSAKANNSELIVIDKFGLEEPQTKRAREILDNIKAPAKVAVVVSRDEESVEKSIRNIADAEVLLDNEISPYRLLNNQGLVFTEKSLSTITEVLKG